MSPATEPARSPADYVQLAEAAWFDGFRARAEGNQLLARRLISKSGRLASVARRIEWIPEARDHG